MPTRAPRHDPRIRAGRATTSENWRPNANARGYGWKWVKASRAYLIRHPLCVHCLAAGLTTASTDVDHIVPHRGDMALFWNHDNWQALCHSCHSIKTATVDGGFGNRRGK